ncbi:hypothetical protein [Spirosoma foliorum]|uniref:Transposase n=1 Tax=Spirosoma foliorum TaxID=2710596 RepID=A0A7G5H1N6_9BACT|nr:hypothetical protein [Spirosoma foliorum]QMW05028.1 hypothetical protein H3H32_09110 [Spirosoma foliorum]
MSNGQTFNRHDGPFPNESIPLNSTGPPARADGLRPVANGEPILALARKMGISDSIIHAWRAAEKKSIGEEKQTSALEVEIESLKRQLRQSEMDRTAEAARD